MGSLGGHVVPGVFFLIYGMEWLLLSFWLQLTTPHKSTINRSSRTGNSSSNHTGTTPLSYSEFKRDMELNRKSYIPQPFCRNIPLESFMKFTFSILGILVETFLSVSDGKVIAHIFHVHDPDGSFSNQSKLHHITMYGTFLLSGVIDLIALFIRIPPSTTKLFLSLAFFIEALLFWFHANGRDDLNYSVHILLTYVIFSCIMFSALRMWKPNNLFINGGLAFSIILQGTWFIQVGVVLYGNQYWDPSDHNNMMFIIALFSWHIISILCSMIIIYIIMLACWRNSIKYQSKGRRRGLRPLPLLPVVQDSQEKEKLIEEDNNNITSNNIVVETVT